MAHFILIIIALISSLYSLICSVECGLGLSLIYPKLAINNNIKTSIITNIWLKNNIFIIILLSVFYLLIDNVFISLGNNVKTLLIVAIISAIFKLITEFYLYNNKFKETNKTLIYLFTLLAYIVPLCFVAIAVNLLTAKQFWQSYVGITLFITSVIGLTIIGLSSINRYKELKANLKLKQNLEILFAIWIILLGFAFPVFLDHFNSSLVHTSLSIMEVVIIVSLISFASLSIKHNKPHELYHYTFLIGFFAPFLIVWNNSPFILGTKITISNFISIKYNLGTYRWLGIFVLIVAILEIVFCLILLIEHLDLLDNLKLKKQKTI